MEATKPTPTRIITQKELTLRVPYSAVQIWRLEKAGNFPRKVQLGPNRIGWVEDEIEEWLQTLMADRGAS